MNGFIDFEQYDEQVSIMSERYTRLPNYVIDSGRMDTRCSHVENLYSEVTT